MFKLTLHLKLQGEDFHQFTCGSFVKKKRIPEEQARIDAFDILRQDLTYFVSGSSKISLNYFQTTKKN
jgi:hypothetical protein